MGDFAPERKAAHKVRRASENRKRLRANPLLGVCHFPLPLDLPISIGWSFEVKRETENCQEVHLPEVFVSASPNAKAARGVTLHILGTEGEGNRQLALPVTERYPCSLFVRTV